MTAPFGDDKTPQEVTFAVVAEQVRAMVPRALTPHALDDAITLVEFMRDQALKAHEANIVRSAELDIRELELAKRAQVLKIHERAVQAVLKGNAPRRLANLWR